jgi:hypothetical protein
MVISDVRHSGTSVTASLARAWIKASEVAVDVRTQRSRRLLIRLIGLCRMCTRIWASGHRLYLSSQPATSPLTEVPSGTATGQGIAENRLVRVSEWIMIVPLVGWAWTLLIDLAIFEKSASFHEMALWADEFT